MASVTLKQLVKKYGTVEAVKGIDLVFENYALYPHMTVYENMEFPLKSRKVAKEEIKKHISTASNILDIEELHT